MLGMTMRQLGDKIGVNLQQIRKFEAATNRFSAKGMWNVAEALEVPVAYLFEGLGGEAHDDILTDKEAVELVRAYYAIPVNQRQRLFDLARVLRAA